MTNIYVTDDLFLAATLIVGGGVLQGFSEASSATHGMIALSLDLEGFRAGKLASRFAELSKRFKDLDDSVSVRVPAENAHTGLPVAGNGSPSGDAVDYVVDGSVLSGIIAEYMRLKRKVLTRRASASAT